MKANEIDQFYQDKKILILGGAGFIGSQLANEFVSLGSKVVIVDGLVPHTGANPKNIQGITEKIDFHDSKVETLENLPALINASDLIIDSIALTSHHYGMENPVFDVQTNLVPHVQLIMSLKNTSNKKIVYLGSRNQYGPTKDAVVTEDTPSNPIDAQSINKAAADSFYKMYSTKYNFDVLSLRITNCFGENQKITDDVGLVGSFIRDILAGQTVEIFGTKGRKKNLLYVKDLVNIVVRLCAQEFSCYQSFNVGGREIILGELLENIISIVGKGSYHIKPFPKEIKDIDIGDPVYSTEKLRNALGELEFSDLKTSLTNTINYFRNNL